MTVNKRTQFIFRPTQPRRPSFAGRRPFIFFYSELQIETRHCAVEAMDFLGDVERRPTGLPSEVVELIIESQHRQERHVDKILSVPFTSSSSSSSRGLRFACPIFLKSVLIRHTYSAAVIVRRLVQQGQGHGPTAPGEAESIEEIFSGREQASMQCGSPAQGFSAGA